MPELELVLRSVFEAEGPTPTALIVLLAELDAPFGRETEQFFARDLAQIRPRLVAYARRLARDANLAEDLAQETLLRAWRSRHRFVTGTSLIAWTRTILRNCYLSQKRRGKWDAQYDENLAEIVLQAGETQTRAVELGEVLGVMTTLSHSHRVALEAVVICGMSYEEAATHLDINLGTLKSRVARARTEMKMALEERPIQRLIAVEPVLEPPLSSPITKPSVPLRNAWAAAKAAGRPLLIG